MTLPPPDFFVFVVTQTHIQHVWGGQTHLVLLWPKQNTQTNKSLIQFSFVAVLCVSFDLGLFLKVKMMEHPPHDLKSHRNFLMIASFSPNLFMWVTLPVNLSFRTAAVTLINEAMLVFYLLITAAALDWAHLCALPFPSAPLWRSSLLYFHHVIAHSWHFVFIVCACFSSCTVFITLCLV